MSGGEFETALRTYVADAEQFVRTMYDGLLELTVSKSHPAIVPQTPKKVLVVEPTEIHRVLFGRYFQGLPLEIRFARNSEESERLQAEGSYDLVITDWHEKLRLGLPKAELVNQVLARLEA